MRNILQSRLKSIEEKNPSENIYQIGLLRTFVDSIKIFRNSLRKTEEIPQQKSIYSRNKEENYKICNELEIDDDCWKFRASLVYRFRNIDLRSPMTQLLHPIKRGAIEVVDDFLQKNKGKDPYQSYAERYMQVPVSRH